MRRRSFLAACGSLALGAGRQAPGPRGVRTAATEQGRTGRVRVLRSVAALPPEIAGVFRSPAAFQQSSSGQFLVFDRLGHTVYGIDRDMTGSWKVVQIGHEAGRILEPTAFASAPNGTFVVADQPSAAERVQLFGSGGSLLGGFTIPGRPTASVTIDGWTLNGIASLVYSGRSIFINQPETGALVCEYTVQGAVVRTFGTLRRTGHESNDDVHLALNTGLPLVNPRGGFYFVFQAGIPVFRRLDDGGRLVFERHIEGPELDDTINNLPTTWPRRKEPGGRVLPVVRPVVRAAAVDAAGSLWVAFADAPFTYVYDATGERTRVVQFNGAGVISPSALSFAPDGRLLVAPGCYIFDPR